MHNALIISMLIGLYLNKKKIIKNIVSIKIPRAETLGILDSLYAVLTFPYRYSPNSAVYCG